MSFLFWLALVIGGGLFLLSLFGDVFGIQDHGGESFHSDVDAHGDTEWGRIFSLRNATYFLFAFGAVGVLLDFVWAGSKEPLAFLFAGATGVLAWVLSAAAFRYLKRTESGELLGDRLLIGRVGEVSLPIQKGGTGKILVTKAGHTQELLAKPLDDDEADPESWNSVLVIEVRDGVAMVTPYSDRDAEL
jgi:membrane protein implicated in regulation of membrane protease activity